MDKQDTGKCGHFSIRGYVAEIRRKDRKICWPFSTVGDDKEPGEQIDMLPELLVPEFRWWCCQNCLQNGRAADAATEIRVVLDSADENLCEGRRGNGNTSMDVIGDECCAMIRIDININEKKMVANVPSNTREDKFPYGDHKKSAERNVNKAVTTLTCYEEKDTRCLNGERITKDAVAGVGFGVRNLKCATNISSEICQKGKGFYLCKSDKISEQKSEFKFPKLPEPENGENEVLNSVNIHSPEFDDSDENEDVYDTHDQHNESQHGNSSRTLHHRKAQKVRSLTDIVRREVLGKIPSSNEIVNSDHINTKVTQPEATQECAGLGLHTDPKSQVPVRENVGKGNTGKKKTRKTPQVEALGSLQMGWSKSVQCYNRDETYVNSAIANSESVNDAFAETGSTSGLKNHLIENKSNEKLIQIKKKKKPRVNDRWSSLTPWQEALSGELQLMSREVDIKRAGAEKICFKSGPDASTGRRLHLFSKTYAAKQKYDRKSIFRTKESKMLQVEDGQTSLVPQQEDMLRSDQFVEINGVGDANFPFDSAVDAFSGRGIDLGCISKTATHRKAVENDRRTNMPQVEGDDSSMMYQEANVRSTGAETVPVKAAQDTIMRRGLHSSLECRMATKRSSKKSILRNRKSKLPQVEGRNASLIPWQGGMSKADQVVSKDVEIKHIKAAIIPFKNSPEACFERGVHFGLQINKVGLRKAGVSKKLNGMLRVEGEVSPIWPKDYYCACNNENTNDVHGHFQVNKNQSDGVNKACEPEASDDIPMEIVELLANNRQKRRLLEAEYANCNKVCMPETTKNVKDAVNMELTGVLDNEIVGLLQERNSYMRKPQSSYAGGGVSPTGGNVEPMEEKLSSYLSSLKRTSKSIGSNINHRDDPDIIRGFPAFLESLEKLSSGNQFVDAGSGKKIGTQGCGCNGNLMDYSCSLTCLQAVGAHPTCQIVSRQASCKEVQHVCSPNVADSPSGIDRFKNFATNQKKYSGKFDFEIFKRINAEQPFVCTRKGNMTCPKMMGSSGLYSNEIMPTMHLLMPMAAGVSSRASVNVDGYQKFPNQFSFLQITRHNEPSPLEDGVFELSNASKHPISVSFGKNHGVGKSCEHFPLGPTLNAVASSVQRDDNFGRTTGFTIKSKRKERTKGSYSLMKSTDSRLSGSVFGTGCLGKNNESFPNRYLQKGLFSALNSTVLPLQSNLVKDSTTHFEVSKTIGIARPVKSSCEVEFCSVNRNPADFTVAEAGNEFMIGGGDLRHRKMFSKRDSHRLINTDCRKRKRLMKPSAMKLHAQH